MALDESNNDGLIELREILNRPDAGLLKEQPNNRPMMNDRDANEASLPSQITGKAAEDLFGGARLCWHKRADRVGLAENRQQPDQCRPISLLRTPVSGATGQVARDKRLIEIRNAEPPEIKPAAQISDQPQTPPGRWPTISLPDQTRRVRVNVIAERPFVHTLKVPRLAEICGGRHLHPPLR